MTLLKFDRLKITADSKCLIEQQTQFNQTYNPKSGELKGEYYLSKDDNRVPFNLYVAVNRPKHQLTLEFSSKILGVDYPRLISKHTIRQCIENINALGICRLDIDGILENGCVKSADVTKDVSTVLSEDELQALSMRVNGYKRYRWQHYEREGIEFCRDVKSAKCKECIRIYNKEKEIETFQNRSFLATLPNRQQIIDHFHGVTRFEIELDKESKLKSYLNIKDTYLDDVLNAEANPILEIFDKIFGSPSDITEIQAANYDDLTMRIMLEVYHYDVRTIEMSLRKCYSSRSGLKKRMDKIIRIRDKMQIEASDGIDHISSVRGFLL